MKKRFGIALSLLLSLSLLLAGCAGNTTPPAETASPAGTTDRPDTTEGDGEPTAAPAEGDMRYAVVFDLGGIGDNGYNTEIFEGCQVVSERYGVPFDYVEPKSVNDYETQVRMYADAEEYELIIAVSYAQEDALRIVAADYPDQKFVILDTVLGDVDNIRSVSARHPEQHFLSGVISGLVTQDERMSLSDPSNNIIGFAIAMDSPVSRAQAAGFMAGARYVNPEVEFLTNYIGSYSDPAKAKEIAMTAYGRGADIVAQNAGASGMGVFAAGEDAGRYVIASSLVTVTPGHTLSVSVKRMETMIDHEISAIVDGTWSGGSVLMGIVDGTCGYSTEGTAVDIPDDILAVAEAVKQDFIDGKITLPDDIDQIDEWTQNNQYQG